MALSTSSTQSEGPCLTSKPLSIIPTCPAGLPATPFPCSHFHLGSLSVGLSPCLWCQPRMFFPTSKPLSSCLGSSSSRKLSLVTLTYMGLRPLDPYARRVRALA